MRLVLAVLLIGLCSGCKDEARSNSEPDFAQASIESQPEAPKTSSPPSIGTLDKTPVKDGAPVNITDWYQPTPLVTWHIQLTDSINTSHDVRLYDIDLFDSPRSLVQQLQSEGKKVICYFSGGSYESWRPDASNYNRAVRGKSLVGWQGEQWLDIRTENVRSIIKSRLDLAKSKGCDGVDPDNMDGYINNSGFNLTAADQLDFNRFVAIQAHLRGLAVGLKNDVDQINELVDYFDFAVNEQCYEYNECATLIPFIINNKPVLHIEYESKYVSRPLEREKLCALQVDMQFSTLILPLELDNEFRLSCN